MPTGLNLQVFVNHQPVLQGDFSGAVELGRQYGAHEPLYSIEQLEDGRSRAVIAQLGEDTMSRRHVLIEPTSPGQVRVTNLSTKVPIHLLDGSLLAAGGVQDLALPTSLAVGSCTLRLQLRGMHDESLNSLPVSMRGAGRDIQAEATQVHTLLTDPLVDRKALVSWLQSALGVIQAAASSTDFFARAARAVVEIVGCDQGRVLLHQNNRWKDVETFVAPGVTIDPEWQPSRSVLARLLTEKRTFWRGMDQQTSLPSESLVGIEMVVVAPILNQANEVIGAVYGDYHPNRPHRRDLTASTFHPVGGNITKGLPRSSRTSTQITDLEAVLVELLAGGVASGMARMEQEKAALEADVRFGQFFTPELSRQLTRVPDLLEGRDSEVTLLFCDIRGFSRISEKLGPELTVKWLANVFEGFSDDVLAHKGVLVDYLGDELMAMWGAPETQPDHAQLACRAALAMISRLPELSQRWQSTLNESLEIGIGVNTGVARVGNMGTTRKFKYGPLGHTVNLASRVQGATKYLRSRLVITESTRTKLDANFHVRRLGKVRVVNIDTPPNLYELVSESTPAWQQIKTIYEKALQEFEGARFRPAAQLVGPLLSQYPDDGPSLVLMSRIINNLIVEPKKFDPVWELPGK